MHVLENPAIWWSRLSRLKLGTLWRQSNKLLPQACRFLQLNTLDFLPHLTTRPLLLNFSIVTPKNLGEISSLKTPQN